MKHLIILLTFATLLGCEKIPEREPISLNFISLNGVPANTAVLNDLDYNSNYDFTFTYQSKSLIKESRIRLTTKYNSDISGMDTERLSKTNFDDAEGTFTYRLIPKEQCEPPSTSGLKNYYFIKIIMINENGVVIEKHVQFDFS
ncbi:hypothetical protein [Acidiluteibacter ferrifornacis]|uniref:Lipoprotein n=1 Tax=Acidiluteibacter ferrifornacis TaxID=2692424 RepID=A0A6N9NKU2_9FLAO|nr:hypothetical protein [Acidiluteibacter ferrifornacis]MBR9831478.1 hypothetical protein [bacterium]NBG67306.1 hypothetical protein [Acidiluteibacter ferrifornacis]